MTKRLPMTAGRLVALLIGVPIALFIIGMTGLNGVAYAGQGSYPVRLALPVQGHTVSVSVDSGSLSASQAGDRLRLTGTAQYSLVRSTVTWHTTPSGDTVSSRCHFFVGVCSFSYRVVLPAGMQVFLSNGSGDVIATGLTSADVTASSNSGNITLTFTKIPDRVRVSDQFGDVTLVLPPGGTAYRVSARSTFGGTSIGVPTDPSSRHVITVADASGDISISN